MNGTSILCYNTNHTMTKQEHLAKVLHDIQSSKLPPTAIVPFEFY